MAEKDKKDNAPADDIVPSPSAKSKKAPVQEDQDDDDEQQQEERRLRQEKVKKRKEEMRKKAEAKRRQEQEEEDEVEEDQPLSNKSSKSKPAAKQPIRENVVNNSVMFLNHPKVKSAPMSQKIAYLQKKGLTQEEIQETIERAGESVPANTPGFSQSTPPSQSYNNPAVPPRPSNYYGAQVPPPGYPQPYPQQQLIPAPPPPQPWYGGKVGLAITIASCVGIGMGFSYIAKNYISPWLFNRSEKDNETKQREEYQTKVFEEMLQSLKSMQQSNTELKDFMKTQGELKDLVKTALDKPTTTTPSLAQSGARDLERMKIGELEAELKKMKAMMVDTKSLQNSASTSTYQTWNPTESKIPAWQRSVSSSGNTSVNNLTSSQQNVESFKSPAKETVPATGSPSSSPSSPDPVPQSYAQILDMVRNGQLPDDIKDIDDKPREPFTPIEKGERESRPKPWQKKVSATEPAPGSPSTAPANTEQANGHTQAEIKPATESKPAEEVVS